MNSKNSKTSKPHIFLLRFTDKLDLRRGENRIALSNLIIYCTWENIKRSCNNNKFKISALTWNDKFELPDGFCIKYSRLFWVYLKKEYGENLDKPSVKIYVNKIENRITFKIKNKYSLELK